LSAAIVEELEPVCSVLWVAYARGWWWRSKHVKQLSDKINSAICASCWMYIQGEHKNTLWFQVVIKSKLTATLHFTALWRRAGKLKISWVNVSAIPYLQKYSSKFWFYNYLKSRSVFVFTLYMLDTTMLQ
jgi:hypothetical protein